MTVTGRLETVIDGNRGTARVQIPAWAIDCTIRLEAVPQSFGGLYWYMRCPVSGKRARRVFLFRNDTSFRCRLSIDPPPNYASSRLSGRNFALQRINALRIARGVPVIEWPAKPFAKCTRTFARRWLVRELKVAMDIANLVRKRSPHLFEDPDPPRL